MNIFQKMLAYYAEAMYNYEKRERTIMLLPYNRDGYTVRMDGIVIDINRRKCYGTSDDERRL